MGQTPKEEFKMRVRVPSGGLEGLLSLVDVIVRGDGCWTFLWIGADVARWELCGVRHGSGTVLLVIE